MKTKLTIRQFTTAVLLSGLSGLAIAGSANSATTALAPKVSAADAEMNFWDMPYLDNAFISTKPQVAEDNIAVGELGTDGVNKDMIMRFAKELAQDQHGLIDSLLIVHKDQLVFESYYRRGRIDLPHMQASSTKSYVSLAVGRAIQLGYLSMADLDKPVVSFLKDLDREKFVSGVETVTLHDALTMSSGLRITRDELKALAEKPEQLKGQKQAQAFFAHSEPVTTDSQTFEYQSIDTKLVMQVLDAVVPGSAKDFIKTELLDKMGISQYQWRDDLSGLPMAPYASKMTSRNMVKWGTLVHNNGKWQGEQLISEAYVKKATNRIVHPDPEEIFFVGNNVSAPGYGYYFWQADIQVGDKSYFSRSAQGGGGQYIILIDELDLIVVTTAHERNDRTMQMTADRILPAFVN